MVTIEYYFKSEMPSQTVQLAALTSQKLCSMLIIVFLLITAGVIKKGGHPYLNVEPLGDIGPPRTIVVGLGLAGRGGL